MTADDTVLRILMAEDSATDAKLIIKALQRPGRSVACERVETEEAMRTALERAWDVVISDWSMPKFTALAALAVLREKQLDLPFIIVSGTIGEDTAAEAMRTGADDFILKARLGRLAPAVDRALRECSERVARRVAERALRKSEARFRRLSECGIIGITVSDLSGKIHEANDAFLSIVGFSREDFLAGRVTGRTLNPTAPQPADSLARDDLRACGIARPWEKDLVHKDGRHVPVLAGAATVDESSEENIAFILDLTERKRAEAALRESDIAERRQAEEARLLRRDKDAAEASNRDLEAFSYSIAHDLRAPLRAISGFSGVILEDYGDKLDTVAHELLHRVTSNAQRMSEMIDALLSLARLSRTELRFQSVDLTQMAHAVFDQLLAVSAGRDVERVVSEDVVAIGDPHLLRMVVENLLGNAWKFTRKQPRARIELGCTRSSPDGVVHFFVRDNGAGFNVAHVDKLFAPFRRLHSSDEFEGTGVGLATSQRIVERHGGRIWAEAVVDAGATFYFTLGPEKKR